MAIRPVDLQLAYLATPQSAAVVSNAQDAPQAAQQAAQSAFAAEVVRREEQIDKPVKVEGGKVQARGERESSGESSPRERQKREPEEEHSGGPFGLAGEGEHFIDVTA